MRRAASACVVRVASNSLMQYRVDPLNKGNTVYEPMTLDLFDYADVPVLRFTIADKSCLLQTSDVDALIQQLIALRVRLDPPQPREPVRSSNFPLEMDPCWYLEHSPLLGPVLLLRHPGAGWMAYSLPPESVERLREALTVKPPIAAAGSLIN
jgi:hypothetical protein